VGVDQLQPERSLFEQVPDRFPVRAGGLHRDLGDPLVGEPTGHRLQRGGERGERTGPLLPPSPTWSGGSHAGNHLVLTDVDPRAPLDQHVHQQPPRRRGHLRRDRRGQPINDAVKRARRQQFEVPGRPLASVSDTGSRAPSGNEHSRTHPDSHPSRRPAVGPWGLRRPLTGLLPHPRQRQVPRPRGGRTKQGDHRASPCERPRPAGRPLLQRGSHLESRNAGAASPRWRRRAPRLHAPARA
jgi:hypothetical protein